MIRRCAAMLLLPLAGCASSYDPPIATDHSAARYQTDLARCHKQVDTAANRTDNATPTSAVRAAFASDEPRRAGIRTCMQSRGYHLTP